MAQTIQSKLLNAVAVTGDGPEVDLGLPTIASAFQIEITGAPTQVVVTVSALIDGTTYGPLAVLDTNQGYISGEIINLLPTVIRKVKANLGTLSGGTNPTVSVYFSGRR